MREGADPDVISVDRASPAATARVEVNAILVRADDGVDHLGEECQALERRARLAFNAAVTLIEFLYSTLQGRETSYRSATRVCVPRSSIAASSTWRATWAVTLRGRKFSRTCCCGCM